MEALRFDVEERQTKVLLCFKRMKRHGKIGERIGCDFVHESKNDEKRMKRI